MTAQISRPDAPVPTPAPAQTKPTGRATAGANSRLEHALALLSATPAIADAERIPKEEVATLLAPWLGSTVREQALPLPGLIELRLAAGASLDRAELERRLNGVVGGGAFVEDNGAWIARIAALVERIKLVSLTILALIAMILSFAVVLLIHLTLVSNQDDIDIIFALGATKRYIARNYARRATALVGGAATIGTLLAVPALIGLTAFTKPFVIDAIGAHPQTPAVLVTAWPAETWLGLVLVPIVASIIAYLTSEGTVRYWLRRFG
jgi:cell division transport system permease protein